ncbi:MAG TPA: L,D-transpeptidase, partial [Vicinamibacterales bacterium]|nr:L,D-transpeptidase [Vicinamibacterales bacterium]
AVMSNELVINIPQRMLFHADQQGEYSAYPVAVGRPDWPTPFGAFTIVRRKNIRRGTCRDRFRRRCAG